MYVALPELPLESTLNLRLMLNPVEEFAVYVFRESKRA